MPPHGAGQHHDLGVDVGLPAAPGPGDAHVGGGDGAAAGAFAPPAMAPLCDDAAIDEDGSEQELEGMEEDDIHDLAAGFDPNVVGPAPAATAIEPVQISPGSVASKRPLAMYFEQHTKKPKHWVWVMKRAPALLHRVLLRHRRPYLATPLVVAATRRPSL